MKTNLTANAQITINAGVEKVWQALVDPAIISQYMFGTQVQTDWKPGSPITWKGEWKDQPYEDKGQIVAIEPHKKLAYTHYSPLTGQDDIPENYHTVTINLSGDEQQTEVNLSQDKNASEEEKEHSKKNWEMMLSSMKKLLES